MDSTQSIIIASGFMALAINYVVIPRGVRDALYFGRDVQKALDDLIIPSDATVLEYLNLANSQMHNGEKKEI